MAKKSTPAVAEVPKPDPMPKVGDNVAYNWPPDAERREISGKTRPATVAAVHEGHDGRLLDVNVDTGKGIVLVKSTPWREEEEEAGNTWHWPSAE